MNISDIRTKVYAQNERSCLVTRSAQVSTPDEAVSTLVDAEQKEPRFSTLTDPLIQALVSKLPPPSSTWSIDDRANWLKALAMVFNLVYRTEKGEATHHNVEKTESASPVLSAVS